METLDAVVILVDAGRAPDALVALGQEGRALGRSRRTWVVPAHGDVDGTIARWSAVPGVLAAVPDVAYPLRVRFDDPHYSDQWYLEDLVMEPLYDVSLGDAAVRVAVIDSSIDVAHPDLVAGIVDPYDAYDDDTDPSPNPGEFCQGSSTAICDDHGTAVSGIVAARANNGEGIVGICPGCTLVPIKLLGDGAGALSADVAAFEHAIESDAAVINNSWGFVDPTPAPAPLADVIHRAATETRGGKGSLVVFASGNDDRVLGNDEIEAVEDVLCVGAIDHYGAPTPYTNTGDALDVVAYSATYSTAPGGYTETFGGTSAAAPVVSGLAGWILSVDPDLTAREVHDLLVSTAKKSPMVTFDGEGHHDTYGYGQVDPSALLAHFFPSDTGDTAEEGPKACGCASTMVSSSAGSWAMLFLGGVVVMVRRVRRSLVVGAGAALLAGCSGSDDTSTEDTDTDTGPACTALQSGDWDGGGSALGMTMGVTLTMDAEACTFTLTDWSMVMGSLPDSGTVDGDAVTLGSTDYWLGCEGTIDSATAFSGQCGDGALFEFEAR